MRAGVIELERQPCLPRRSHFCEGWSAARFVIREFFLLTFLSVAAEIAPLNARSPVVISFCVAPGNVVKRCWEKL
jgi:hypothetical protein